MAFTGYLKIEGIDGESKRADHEGGDTGDAFAVQLSGGEINLSLIHI